MIVTLTMGRRQFSQERLKWKEPNEATQREEGIKGECNMHTLLLLIEVFSYIPTPCFLFLKKRELSRKILITTEIQKLKEYKTRDNYRRVNDLYLRTSEPMNMNYQADSLKQI